MELPITAQEIAELQAAVAQPVSRAYEEEEPMAYERTVEAALAETKSKFALAEALALDIPPRGRVRHSDGDKTVATYIEEARERILAAGGEARHVKTLEAYRETALWTTQDVLGDFHWVEGKSYSAHYEAYRSGIPFADFAANPKTVRELRQDAGRVSPDGGGVVKSWTSERKIEAARELLSDPQVAEQVSEQITDYVASSPERTSEAVRKRHENAGVPERQPKPAQRDYDEMVERWVNLAAVTLAAESSGRWTPTERSEALMYFVTQILGDRREPTGENADLVSSKLESLFSEVEAYANSEVS